MSPPDSDVISLHTESIARLEMRQSYFEKDLNRLERDLEDFSKRIQSLETSIKGVGDQITRLQYWAMGAAAILVFGINAADKLKVLFS